MEVKQATKTECKNLWVKIRYSINGKTQSLKAKDFWKIEDEFLPGYSHFADGFVGYYHKDALCEMPITAVLSSGKQVQMKKVGDKFMVREVPQDTQ